MKNDEFMTGEFKVLAPLAEALALTTNNSNKNIILGALDLTGQVNLDALKMVVSEIGNIFPQIKARLKEVKIHRKNCLAWEFGSESDPPALFIHEANINNDSMRSSLKILLDSLAPRLDRERDIFQESAAEFHLLSFDKNRHILACVLWHPAGDAITFAEIVKAFMSMYHELVTGQDCVFSNHPMSVSTGSKRFIHSHKTNLADYSKTFREAIIPYSCCSVPRGNGVPGDFREHYIKRLLSEAETQRLVSNTAKMRATFVDYLLSTVCLSVDRWNDARKTESSMISAALTVNMQGRNRDQEGPNNDSVLYFRFSREQRKDPKILARTVYRARIRKFREGADLKYSKGLAKVNNLLRNFPFSIRQKAYVKILQKHQTSFALGFIGVLWPESLGRNISGDSYLKQVGGLGVIEAHGIAYRIVSRTPLYLTAYFFRKRLNLILSASAWLFTKDEAQEFLDLITNMMLEYEPGDSTS
ncbi:MAG: hypothetical protein M0T73_15890 [Deltaproteobacteria bacterium]|nr:hypothetical protein [Deltaproteobacteria bacterium]